MKVPSFLILAFVRSDLISSFSLPFAAQKTSALIQKSRSTTALFAKKKSSKSSGVYVRPSGAIERGSGFFIPGLEGPRVRLVVGSVLLLLTGVNHFTSLRLANTLSFEETVAIFYSLLVLFQAVIEFGKEELIVEGGSSISPVDRDRDLVQTWATSNTMDEAFKSKVQWAAASYLSVTSASQLMLLQGTADNKNIIAYRLGNDTPPSDKESETGIQAALDQLRQSKGGRISLPLTHPAATTLVSDNEVRCIVLQRITDDSCWMMTSDQLLASFTSTDLKWLGRLATYVKA
jgi:hypothetical protein